MNPEYKQWLTSLKSRIQSAQIKAALKVNAELIALYWELGQEIGRKEVDAQWGEKLIPQLSKDLLESFPDMKGFSQRNLFYIRQWVGFYSQSPIVQQPIAQKGKIIQQPVGQVGQQLVDLTTSAIHFCSLGPPPANHY